MSEKDKAKHRATVQCKTDPLKRNEESWRVNTGETGLIGMH